MPAPLDLTNQRFGKLVVIAEGRHRKGRRTWKCRCDCGAIARSTTDQLRRGHKQSCGCLWKASVVTHGGSKTKLYRVWQQMWRRCSKRTSKEFHNYGARGITVVARWKDFGVFANDICPKPTRKHSLERIDNNGPYAPHNCRWAKPREQHRNKRTNRWITHDGVTLTLTDWATRIGMSLTGLHRRLSYMNIEDALTLPKRNA